MVVKGGGKRESHPMLRNGLLVLLVLTWSQISAGQRRRASHGQTSRGALRNALGQPPGSFFGSLRKTLQKEINAFQDSPVMTRVDEDVVTLLKRLPEAVEEGHNESMERLRRLFTLAIRRGPARALRELPPMIASLAGMAMQGEGMSRNAEPSQADLLADLEAHSQGLTHSCTKFVQRSQEAHLMQALERLSNISERSMEVDDKAALEAVRRIIVMMRTTTDGGMVPGADGNRKKLTANQYRLVVELIPNVIEMFNRLEKEKGRLGKDPQFHLYIAEALGFKLGTESFMSQARALDQVARMSRSIDMAMRQEPSFDAGMAYVIRGMYHLNCPRPLKSVSKARECFDKALQIAPKSGRNLYFAGITAYLEKDFEQAIKYYQAAQGSLATEVRRDPQYAYLQPECQRGLELAQRMLQRDAKRSKVAKTAAPAECGASTEKA